jgi:hypothetical protein
LILQNGNGDAPVDGVAALPICKVNTGGAGVVETGPAHAPPTGCASTP